MVNDEARGPFTVKSLEFQPAAKDQPETGVYASPAEAIMALDRKAIHLQAKIRVRISDRVPGRGQAPEGWEPGQQWLAETTLGRVLFNDLLPAVPLWERFNNNPMNDKKRVTGWPPLTDKIFQNGSGDNFTVVMLMDGTLYKL